MSLSKVWWTSANMALASFSTAARCAHSSIWALGAMLTGNQSGTNGPEGARPSGVNWTLVGSSNKLTAGIDSTDRLHFAGAFTDGDWVRATAGTAHSWFVLQSPAGLLNGPWYLCFDYIGPTNDQTCSLVISKNVFSGGSITARPTSVNESVLTSVQFCSTTAAAGKTHLVIDANGGFRWLRSRNATGYFDTFISVESLVESHSGDLSRTFLHWHFNDGSPGVLQIQLSGNVLRGLCWDGTTPISSNYCSITESIFRPLNSSLNQYSVPNTIDGTVDFLPNIYVYDNTATLEAIRGRYPDMWEVGAQVAVGSTFPSTGSPERTMVGHRAIAFSVAPSL